MKTKHLEILKEVNEQIEKLKSEIESPTMLADTVTQIINEAIKEINESIIINGFSTVEDEIRFFKVEKPQILASFFYHNCVYKLETFKPKHGKKEIKEYLMNKKVELKLFADENHEFYKYYQSGSTRFDSIYFVRGKFDIKTSITSMYLMVDKRFCTFHCFLSAKILANQLFSEYLDSKLLKEKEKLDASMIENTDALQNDYIHWTKSKTELVELIYALIACKAFNHGGANTNKVVRLFEQLFNVDLGQYHSTIIDIKKRKTGKTKFIDFLKQVLLHSFGEI